MLGTIIGAIILGAILGYLAKLILPGRQNIPAWATIGAGFAAALIGGVIADLIGVGETSGFDWIKHGIQLVLALIAVSWVAGAFARRRGTGGQGPGRNPAG